MKIILFFIIATVFSKTSLSNQFCDKLPDDSKEIIDKNEPIDGKYLLINKIIHNSKENYEKWQAKDVDNGKALFIKLFLKKEGKDFWRYNDNYPIPKYECGQLSHINQLTLKQNISSVKFEQCLVLDNTGGSSNITYYSVFNVPYGETLAEYCIFSSCREKLAFIAKSLYEALKILSIGPSSYFIEGHINANNIYYYEKGLDRFITLTDIKYNENPENDIEKRPWKTDMEDVGILLAKLLAQSCNFELDKESRQSALGLYFKIHQLEEYDYYDSDLGVPEDITHSSQKNYNFDEKEAMMQESIYNFIRRSLEGSTQFANPDEAIKHPFIRSLETIDINRPSDL